ncbi:MAG: NADH-quinone oxidoreductase subunit A, partial [Vicinamibacterales bacterium]
MRIEEVFSPDFFRNRGSMDGWLGVIIMIALGVGFAGVMIGLSILLGPRNPTPEKLAPYECG